MPNCPSDDLKQKVAKKLAKTLSDDTNRCAAESPNFAYTSGGGAAIAYRQAELDLLCGCLRQHRSQRHDLDGQGYRRLPARRRQEH